MRFLGGPGCDGALSEYIAVPGEYCFPVPPDMTSDVTSMVEPTAVALHAVELSSFKPGETALVVGLGSIGLLTAQILLNSGASMVAGIDILPHRCKVAKQLGVHHTFTALIENSIDPSISWIQQITEKRGFDITFDCTNRSEGIVIACHGTRPAGRSVLVGISGVDYDRIPVSIARRRELNLQWCRRFRYNFPTAIQLIAQKKIHIHPLLTHHFKPEQTQMAFEMVAQTADNLIKASIDWV
jgi:threonine dehydrogenase-like Zn-dependent dehydrogenase